MATYIEQLKGYVKFLRGTPAAWKTITNPHPDTLYFISEPDAKTGKLYLGKKLISDGGLSVSASSLGDLADILMSETVMPNSILVYNAETDQWEDKPFSTLLTDIGVATLVGATEYRDGVAGFVPVPLAGQQDLFLKGDGSWANPVAGLFDSAADANKTIRKIAQEEVANLLNEGDPEKLDTLKDIFNWIETHNTVLDVADAEARIVALEVATFGVEDKDHPENNVPGLISIVSNLEIDVNNLETKYEELNNRLQWSNLTEQN